MKIKELLTKENWIQGANSLDQDGGLMDPESEHAFCWCLIGAIEKCYGIWENRSRVGQMIANKIDIKTGDCFERIAIWNDKEERTFEDVKKLVEELDI